MPFYYIERERLLPAKHCQEQQLQTKHHYWGCRSRESRVPSNGRNTRFLAWHGGQGLVRRGGRPMTNEGYSLRTYLARYYVGRPTYQRYFGACDVIPNERHPNGRRTPFFSPDLGSSRLADHFHVSNDGWIQIFREVQGKPITDWWVPAV